MHAPHNRTQHGMDRCHHQSGWDALPADIANYDPQPAFWEREEIVKVAADLARGLIVRRDLPSRERRRVIGQKGSLNSLSRSQLLLDTFAFAHLCLLRFDHL